MVNKTLKKLLLPIFSSHRAKILRFLGIKCDSLSVKC